jgi:hypothetical protein
MQVRGGPTRSTLRGMGGCQLPKDTGHEGCEPQPLFQEGVCPFAHHEADDLDFGRNGRDLVDRLGSQGQLLQIDGSSEFQLGNDPIPEGSPRFR